MSRHEATEPKRVNEFWSATCTCGWESVSVYPDASQALSLAESHAYYNRVRNR